MLVAAGSGSAGVSECLCIETFSANCLGFHSTPNTLLHEIVTELQDQNLLEAVSSGLVLYPDCSRIFSNQSSF